VDDLIIFGKNSVGVDLLKRQLKEAFDMKDMGNPGEIAVLLGDSSSPAIGKIDTSKFTNAATRALFSILKRFNMENSSPVSTSMATGTKLCKSTNESMSADQKQYQSNVGSQMYHMLCTRHNLVYTISQISQISTNPLTVHATAEKRSLHPSQFRNHV